MTWQLPSNESFGTLRLEAHIADTPTVQGNHKVSLNLQVALIGKLARSGLDGKGSYRVTGANLRRLTLKMRSRAISLERITSTTKVELVQRSILEAIFSGKLRPGDRILEAQLAGQLGVAQATVNQALLELHSQGVVFKSLNKSTTVRRFGPDELEALFLVRSSLECLAAVAASRNATPKTVEPLRLWLDRMRSAAQAKDLSNFYLADYEFHQELYRLSDNQFLFRACQAIAAAPFAYVLSGNIELMPISYEEIADDHGEIIEALLSGEAKSVEVMTRKMKTWLKVQLRFLKETLSSGKATQKS